VQDGQRKTVYLFIDFSHGTISRRKATCFGEFKSDGAQEHIFSGMALVYPLFHCLEYYLLDH
jgi:hypothetical protein